MTNQKSDEYRQTVSVYENDSSLRTLCDGRQPTTNDKMIYVDGGFDLFHGNFIFYISSISLKLYNKKLVMLHS